MAMSDTYEWDGDPKNPPTDHVKPSAREFRYHFGWARYLMRDREPETLAPTSTRYKPRPSGQRFAVAKSGQPANATAVTIVRGPLPHGRSSETSRHGTVESPFGVLSDLHRRAADRVIRKPQPLEIGRVVQIAPVKDDR